MKIQFSPHLRKALWLLLAVFLLILQPALATELTDEELLAMPAVSITYKLEKRRRPHGCGCRAHAEPAG